MINDNTFIIEGRLTTESIFINYGKLGAELGGNQISFMIRGFIEKSIPEIEPKISDFNVEVHCDKIEIPLELLKETLKIGSFIRAIGRKQLNEMNGKDHIIIDNQITIRGGANAPQGIA